MSDPKHIGNRPRLPATLAISAGALILGIPVAIAALQFEKYHIPDFVLGSKTIKTAPGETKTIDFGLLSGPNDAIKTAAYISIMTSILFVLGLVIVRHFSKHNIFGWALVIPAVVDVAGTVACMAYVFVVNGKHPTAVSREEIAFVDGKYETDGKMYTRESWVCSMEKLYPETESSWAKEACDDMKTGKIMTIPLFITSILLLALALWQVQRRGGFGWLFGRRASIAVMSRSKNEEEYIGLRAHHHMHGAELDSGYPHKPYVPELSSGRQSQY